MTSKLLTNILDLSMHVLLTIAVILSPWFYGSVDIQHKYLIHVVTLFAMFIWLLKANLTEKKFTYYPAYLPIFFLLALSVLSILFSIYRYASILDTLSWISYVSLFFLVSQIMITEKRVYCGAWVISLTGVFYAIYGILQHKGYIPHSYWAQSNSLASRFVNSGSFGAFIITVTFVLLGLILSTRNIILKAFSALIFIFCVISLVFSNSRLSWVSFIASFLIFTLLIFKKFKRVNRKAFAIGLIFIILIFISTIFKSLIWERIHVISQTQYQSIGQRVDAWLGTLKIIITHPFGSGAGTFQYIYPAYRIHSDRFFVDFAHSDLLQIAGELGFLGAGLFAWFLISLIKLGYRKLAIAPGYSFFLQLGLFCSVIAFVTQSSLDFCLHIPACAVLFFVVAGLLLANSYDDKQKIVKIHKHITLAVVALIILSLSVFWGINNSRKLAIVAEKEFMQFNWQDALRHYQESSKFMPLEASNYANIGSIYAFREVLSFKEDKSLNRKLAEDNFKRAVRLNRYNSTYYLNLALLYAKEGRRQDAMRNFRLAIDKSPMDGELYYPYADFCLESGMLDDALLAYKKALNLFINDDGYFPRNYRSFDGFLQKIYKFTQDYGKLRQIIPVQKLDIRMAFARFLEYKGMKEEALAEYQQIVERFSDNQAAKDAISRIMKD